MLKRRGNDKRGRGILSLGYSVLLLSGCVKVEGNFSSYVARVEEEVLDLMKGLEGSDVVLGEEERVPLFLGEGGQSFTFSLGEEDDFSRVREVVVMDEGRDWASRGDFFVKRGEGLGEWCLEFDVKVPVGEYSVKWQGEGFAGETLPLQVVSEGLSRDDVMICVRDVPDRKTLALGLEEVVWVKGGEAFIFVEKGNGERLEVAGVVEEGEGIVLLELGEELEEGEYSVVFGKGSLASLWGEVLEEEIESDSLFLGREFFEGEHLISVTEEKNNDDKVLLLGIGSRGGSDWGEEGMV